MADGTGVFAPPHRALSFGILVSISAIATEGMAVATVMPTAATELGGLDWYGWAFSAFMLLSRDADRSIRLRVCSQTGSHRMMAARVTKAS
jgi:hypothetical protein